MQKSPAVLRNIEQPNATLDSNGFWRDTSFVALANAIVGFCFAASGPVAVILSVGSKGGLTDSQLASWVFAAFFINGCLTIAACWRYRTPMVFFWTIPGTVLVGPALTHLSFPQVVGAFYFTGLLMLVLGLSGWVKRAMAAIPMPIVMAMVAGVFLQFGLDWVRAVQSDFLIAGGMTAAFILLTAMPMLGRYMPPVIGALLVGLTFVWLSGRLAPAAAQATAWFVLPQLVAPAFSWQAMVELVVPLAVTVIVVQNGQGVAVLKSAGHQPPVNFITAACGSLSAIVALFGCTSTCLTGPTNALITGSGPGRTHYTAAIFVGFFGLFFGMFAPALTRWMLATPIEFIATLAGLAMFRVLQSAFTTAFSGGFKLGALLCFLITVSELSIFRIGAPFWGLVFGWVLSWFIEREDFKGGS